MIADELVKPEKGTGAVMCCTFGDNTDIIWYKKHKLPFVAAIGLDGKMTAVAGEFAGLKVAEARTHIIERLKEQKLLVSQKSDYACCCKCMSAVKNQIEYTLFQQWFIKILPYKKDS